MMGWGEGQGPLGLPTHQPTKNSYLLTNILQTLVHRWEERQPLRVQARVESRHRGLEGL